MDFIFGQLAFYIGSILHKFTIVLVHWLNLMPCLIGVNINQSFFPFQNSAQLNVRFKNIVFFFVEKNYATTLSANILKCESIHWFSLMNYGIKICAWAWAWLHSLSFGREEILSISQSVMLKKAAIWIVFHAYPLNHLKQGIFYKYIQNYSLYFLVNSQC